jgi:hypothetical protein
MTKNFQFEKNLETEVSAFLVSKGLKAYPTFGMVELAENNIQVAFEYSGINESGRQVINNQFEYDMHEGQIMIQVQTYRENDSLHHERIGKVRANMTNGINGFTSTQYEIFDIQPQSTSTIQNEENNLDQSTLMFQITFKLDHTKI